MDWVLIIFGTQVVKKKRLVRPVFSDYLSVSYDYAFNNKFSAIKKTILLVISLRKFSERVSLGHFT